MNKSSNKNVKTWCLQLIIIHVHAENKDRPLYDATLLQQKKKHSSKLGLEYFQIFYLFFFLFVKRQKILLNSSNKPPC